MKNRTPLVLISGILCQEKMWHHQVSYFAQKMPVKVVNFLPHQSVTEHVEKIGQAYPQMNVVGFSSGGYVAQAISAIYPEKVNYLTLINTFGKNSALKQQAQRGALLEGCEKGKSTVGMKQFIDKILSSYSSQEPFYQELESMLTHSNPKDFFQQMQAIYDYVPHLPPLDTLSHEVMVLLSQDDPFVTQEASEEMQTKIHQLTFFGNPETGGHMLPLSKPDYVNEQLANFMQ